MAIHRWAGLAQDRRLNLSLFLMGEIMKPLVTVRFLKVQCDCKAVNYNPVYDNKLIIEQDEERRCSFCGKIVPQDRILESYSKLQQT